MWRWTIRRPTQDTHTRNPLPTADIKKQDIGPNTSYANGQTGQAE